MSQYHHVRQSAHLSQLCSCPHRGSSPSRMTASMPTLSTTPEMNWVFDEDTGGSIHHDLDQCKACKTWYNHYIEHHDKENDSWCKACQSCFNLHCQKVLLSLEKSGGCKEFNVLSWQVEKFCQELSSLTDKNWLEFQHSQLWQAKELNHTLRMEHEEVERECEKMLGELFELHQKICHQERENKSLCWQLQDTQQKLLQDVKFSTTRLSYAHQTPRSTKTNTTKGLFGTGNMVPRCKVGL